MTQQHHEALKRIDIVKKIQKKILDLSFLCLKSIPDEIMELYNLQGLDLTGNQLRSVPVNLGNLLNLQVLYLSHNQLKRVPECLEKLQNLQVLYLSHNHLETITDSMGNLRNLRKLLLSVNQLASIPESMGNLQNLRKLLLSDNRLESLPESLGNLQNLQELYLSHNQLASIPESMGNLQNLRKLLLSDNRLESLPESLGNLQNLYGLDLSRNQLVRVPESLGNLQNLQELYLSGNPKLFDPPPEIFSQGKEAVFAFLRERAKCGKKTQWVSKLLFVGEGGVGKTSLLKSLQSKPFNSKEDTTLGVVLDELRLQHPEKLEVEMVLNTWDFGGQQIYHATHQFFLTERSLYILVWNARIEYKQSNINYWLDNIKARAPHSPILLVATNIDIRPAYLPVQDLMKKYPQIIGHWAVSNEGMREGIAELKEALRKAAAALPLMGNSVPANWANAAEKLQKHPKKCISPDEFSKILLERKVRKEDIRIVSKWLHDLGKILYYIEDDDLNECVMLNPNWVTEHVFKVLDNENIKKNDAILTKACMREIWKDIDPTMQEHFLRLMEKFDLSYQTKEDKEKSLVVEHLSYNPPEGYETLWDSKKDANEITMKLSLNTVLPPGIPTWFIARQHRFTTHNHWLRGAVLVDPYKNHLALVRAYPEERYLQLTVRGPYPPNFFSLLKDGIDLTLARFPGIEVKRTIPCPDPIQKKCNHEFDYDLLMERLENRPDKTNIECPVCLEDINIRDLLTGLAATPLAQFMEKIKEELAIAHEEREEHKKISLDILSWAQRQFILTYNALQQKEETHCPRIFTFSTNSSLLKKKLTIQLYCEEPGHFHPIETSCFEFKFTPDWLARMVPYINGMLLILKLAVPYISPVMGLKHEDLAKQMSNEIKIMELTIKEMEYIKVEDEEMRSRKVLEHHPQADEISSRIFGKELDALHELLKPHITQDNRCGGLKKHLTPEGHWLWLCEEHVKQYKA